MTRVTAVRFTPNTVTMKIDGVPVYDRIEVSPYVPMVGHYFLHRPVVRVDAKITDLHQRQSIVLHEAVERHMRRGGLGPMQAHRVAERQEGHWDIRHGVSIPRLTQNVEKVFRQNAREGVRRRR